MRGRVFTSLLAAAVFLLPAISFGYVGPGAGLSAIGTVLALIGGIFLAIAGFVWYPIKRLLKKRRQPKETETVEPDDTP